MEENQINIQRQKEKTKDNIVNTSSSKINVKNNVQQVEKQETKVLAKKNIGLLIAIIVTILVISILGMTAYSRYRSKIVGQGTAQVASWSFKVNGSTESIANFDLATTRSDTNGKVAEGVIAPGTNGSFEVEIDGSGSEVAIEYMIEMDVQSKPTNLKFYRNSDFTDEIVIGEDNILNIQGYIDLEKINTKLTERIYWNWPYRTGETEEEKKENDKIDTQEMGKTVEMPIKVIGRQSNSSSNNLLQSTIEVVSPNSGTYKQGQEIIIQVNYSNNIYGGANKVGISEVSAPEMKIKFKNGTEKQANYKSSEGKYIQYAYTIKDYDYGELQIVSYLGNVYNEAGELFEVKTKNLSGNNIVANATKTLADVVSVGDYVNYNANDNGEYSYTTEEKLTGSSIKSTFSSSDTMKWRVLSVDKTSGTVELMSADVTGKTIKLSGSTGYANSNTVFNNACAVYGHGKGATGGRSIRVQDIEQYSSYDKTTYANNEGYKYGDTETYTSGEFYKQIKDEEGNVTGYEKELTRATEDNPITMTQTYYQYKIQNYFSNDTIYNMICMKSTDTSTVKPSFYLADYTANVRQSNCAFSIRTIRLGYLFGDWYMKSDGTSGFPAYTLSPVVSLESNIQTTGQDSSGAWNLII